MRLFSSRVSTALAVCLLAFACVFAAQGDARSAQGAAPARDALSTAVDAAIDKALTENRLVGAVVLVARDGQIVYRRAAGYADREAQKPVRENTIFRLASISKAYTSMAAAALLAQGTLHLDDPITKWLPDFTPSLPDGGKAVITVRQLLSHTAGLNYGFSEKADGPYHKAGVSDGLDLSDVSLKENLRRIASVPLLYKPGTSWRYSIATDVLGAVIAEASGMSLPQAMETLVTRPLGLTDTGFGVSDPSRLATAYYNASPRPLPMRDGEQVGLGNGASVQFFPSRIFEPAAFPSGGAGMAGTAPDLLRLLESIRTGAPLAGPSVMREMVRNQTGEQPVMPGYGFALGWAVLVSPLAEHTPKSLGTLTWGGVYGGSWFVDPERKLSVVILTNTAPEGMGGRAVQDVRDAVYQNLQ